MDYDPSEKKSRYDIFPGSLTPRFLLQINATAFKHLFIVKISL